MSNVTRRKFLKVTSAGTAGLTLGGLSGILSGQTNRPNIIVMLADDMGYSDIGCYGSEIDTPHIDQMADEGLRFTQFYNAARCSPTRASLLTGLYPHQAGMGWLAGPHLQSPGYIGHLNEECVTMGEILRQADYRTMMVGKWHIGNPGNNTTPWSRGFDRYFGKLVQVDYWDPSGLWLDGSQYDWPTDNYYLTDAQGTFASHFINRHINRNPDQPFFMYLSFNAPHWPLHAREEDVQRYRGEYMMGWDELRKQRYRNMKQQGIISGDHALTPRDPAVPSWDSVSSREQDEWDHKMAVYAAQVYAMDRAVGKVLDTLEKNGAADNTLILFLSDNGACAEGIGRHNDQIGTTGGTPPGGPDSFQAYLMPWGNASSTPFRMYKHWSHEGGIATPLVARWPAGMETTPGSITDQPGHVIDIMATSLDVADYSYPDTFLGRDIKPLEGRSLLPIFKGQQREGHTRIFWEHEGHRAVREGRWKLVSMHETDDFFYDRWGYPSPNEFQSGWELYDLEQDRLEQNDLSDQYPERVNQMAEAYANWAEKVGVEDWQVIREKLGFTHAGDQSPTHSYRLEQNYPNPFNPTTTIRFSLRRPQRITLRVYNSIGEKVTTLVNRKLGAGSHSVEFNGSELPSGVYLYRLKTPEYTQSRKMLLLK